MNKSNAYIQDREMDEERALYGLDGAEIINCAFRGAADGESAIKECKNIAVKNCVFGLRYPLWHAENFTVSNCSMDVNARAAVWYGKNGRFENCSLNGIKVFRECKDVSILNCDISSFESGWHCINISFENSRVNSEYLLLGSREVTIKNCTLDGKYPLQYTENVLVENCEITSKDCLWHAKNVVIKDSVLRGEYLAWYSDNLTLINCTIEGTQPLCYCKNLKLVNCRTINCDLAFELSEIEADICGEILSVRSPLSGTVVCDGVGKIVNDVTAYNCNGKVIVRKR